MTTLNISVFPAWDSLYVWYGEFAGEGFPMLPLLAGVWAQYPELQVAWVVFNVIQLAIAATAFGWFVGRVIDVIENGYDSVYVADDDTAVELMLIYTVPLLLMLWQVFIGCIGISVAYVALSSPTATWIYLHSWVELTILVLRVMALRKVHAATFMRFTVWWIIAFFAMTVVFMLTDDIYVKLVLSGLALVSDFGNAFVAPMLTYKLLRASIPPMTHYRHDLVTALDVWGMLLSVIHVIIFYPEAIVAALGFSEIAGIIMVVTTAVNVLVLTIYIIIMGAIQPVSRNALDVELSTLPKLMATDD